MVCCTTKLMAQWKMNECQLRRKGDRGLEPSESALPNVGMALLTIFFFEMSSDKPSKLQRSSLTVLHFNLIV